MQHYQGKFGGFTINAFISYHYESTRKKLTLLYIEENKMRKLMQRSIQIFPCELIIYGSDSQTLLRGSSRSDAAGIVQDCTQESIKIFQYS